MRILILQLARFGDIFQTWPTLRALRRKYPQAQIEIMVRQRFSEAISLYDDIDKVYELPTQNLLAPFLTSSQTQTNSADASLECLEKFIEAVKGDGEFDQIINLSFSPISSYLVDEFQSQNTDVRGYARHRDGYLRLADDASAFFYAQVGPGRANRLHLIDLFAGVADVQLEKSDFTFATSGSNEKTLDTDFIVVHVGSSHKYKAVLTETWDQILRGLVKTRSELIYLVGTASEALPLEWLKSENRIVDLCGKTSVRDLPPLVAGAKAVVGADSMLLQIANLTNTPCLNISFACINFWETGPRADGSRVLTYADPKTVDAIEVRHELCAIIDAEGGPSKSFRVKESELEKYSPNNDPYDPRRDFQWKLIKAMYLGLDYPITDQMHVALAFQRIHELGVLGLEQIEQIEKVPNDGIASGILDEVDHLMKRTASTCEEVSPMVRWFLAEKTRIEPGGFNEVLNKTHKIFEQLVTVTRLYSLRTELNDQFPRKDLSWK